MYIDKLREITKPVLKELEVEISTKGKNKSAFAQIPMNFTPRQDEQMLEPVWRSFTKEVYFKGIIFRKKKRC